MLSARASDVVAGADGLLPPPQPSPTGEGAVCWQVSDVVASRFSHPLPNPSPLCRGGDSVLSARASRWRVLAAMLAAVSPRK